MKKYYAHAKRIIRDEGFLQLAIVSLQFTQKNLRKGKAKKYDAIFLVDYDDIEKANWFTNPYKPRLEKRKAPYTINWVMSPPGRGSGGHQNIFRFIKFLESRGHTCRVYIYSSRNPVPVERIKDNLKVGYSQVSATMEYLNGPMDEADAVFATGWETAYPVFNDPGTARKMYFVQDFEPLFYPVGSEYVLAENTYRFGFYGITAGGWLADKLKKNYGMQCSYYDFGAERELYKYSNKSQRKEVFFYARPVTPRRGFELGIMALDIFHKNHPEYVINLAGWDVSTYKIPFPYNNLKSLSLDQLSDVYNRCSAALVVSLTNMSLLPLELLSCGTIPIVNEGENNRMVSSNPYIEYAPASPDGLAAALSKVVTKKDLPDYAQKASQSVQGVDWQKAGGEFEKALKGALNG